MLKKNEVCPLFGVYASGQMPDEIPNPEHFRLIATSSEAIGYDSVWCGDHISFGNPIIEGTVALAYLAACTRSITIGTGVLLLALRPPSLVAKQMASLDYLTSGRLICGVGVGGESKKDFESVQVPIKERGGRTTEGIAALRTLWTNSPASFSGTYYQFEDVSLNPMPERVGGPPIWVGGRADPALHRAGTLADGWIAYMVSPESFASGLEKVRTAAIQVDRDPNELARAMMVPTRVERDGSKAIERLRAHLSKRYQREFSPEQIKRFCLVGSPQEVIERVSEYSAAGVEHFIFLYGGSPSTSVSQFELIFETVVLPIKNSYMAI